MQILLKILPKIRIANAVSLCIPLAFCKTERRTPCGILIGISASYSFGELLFVVKSPLLWYILVREPATNIFDIHFVGSLSTSQKRDGASGAIPLLRCRFSCIQ